MNKLISFALGLIFLFSLPGCATRSITCTVLDAETKEPIEGAVALAFWKKTTGLGFTTTKTVRIEEAVTGKDGKFTIPAGFVPMLADRAHMKVYEFGYVGWDSKEIYLGHYGDNVISVKSVKRKGFEWKNQEIFLEKFKEDYSYISHRLFLNDLLPSTRRKDFYREAIEAEATYSSKERDILYQKRNR